MIKFATALILALIFSSHASITAEMVEHPSLQPFMPLVGNWRIIQDMPTESGMHTNSNNHATIKPIFTSKGIEIVAYHELPSGGSYTMHQMLTYDIFAKLYRMSAIDDGNGRLDVYEGHMRDGVLEIDNLNSGTGRTLDDGSLMHFKLRWSKIERDRFHFDIFVSRNNGESWQVYAHQIFERKK